MPTTYTIEMLGQTAIEKIEGILFPGDPITTGILGLLQCPITISAHREIGRKNEFAIIEQLELDRKKESPRSVCYK